MNEKQRLMIKIAKLYYESGLTQDTISQRLRLSRPRVSRLMQEAVEQGIVKISIVQEPGSFADLEQQLENRYGLLEVLVSETVDPSSAETVSRDLGFAAAEYFSHAVFDGDVVGLTWGATLAAMVENLHPEKKHRCVIVQLVGGLGEPQSETHATGLVSRTAIALGASMRLMPAPGVVSSINSAQLLRSDRYIGQALEIVKKADVAFVGIGAPTRDSLLMRNEYIITWQEMDALMLQGAIGDIGLHFFNIYGQPVEAELDERVMGISLADLRAIERVVGVAGGADKFNAILGAIRGKLINILITDRSTAEKLLDIPG